VDNSVEVRYAGVVVGRGALVKELGPDAIFVGIQEPLPVGTLVTLKIGDAVREARVDDVVESVEPSAAGMRVRWGGAALATRPAPAKAAAPAPSAKAAAPAPAVAPPAAARAEPAAPAAAPQAAAPVADSAPVAADSGPSSMVAAEAGDEGSGAIPAPLSLAGPSGDASQPGGGKRRRKRR
jgi:2-oxoglutarate dehydrogenase E2 component (dihydrolipoamide succinyltransferase)